MPGIGVQKPSWSLQSNEENRYLKIIYNCDKCYKGEVQDAVKSYN